MAHWFSVAACMVAEQPWRLQRTCARTAASPPGAS